MSIKAIKALNTEITTPLLFHLCSCATIYAQAPRNRHTSRARFRCKHASTPTCPSCYPSPSRNDPTGHVSAGVYQTENENENEHHVGRLACWRSWTAVGTVVESWMENGNGMGRVWSCVCVRNGTKRNETGPRPPDTPVANCMLHIFVFKG